MTANNGLILLFLIYFLFVLFAACPNHMHRPNGVGFTDTTVDSGIVWTFAFDFMRFTSNENRLHCVEERKLRSGRETKRNHCSTVHCAAGNKHFSSYMETRGQCEVIGCVKSIVNFICMALTQKKLSFLINHIVETNKQTNSNSTKWTQKREQK